MIYVTQGHSQGIGLEVFFKALALLTPREQKNFTLIADPNRTSLPRGGRIKILPTKNSSVSPSLAAIKLALKTICSSSDLLITLPTSKEDLKEGGVTFLGHTEYLRHHYGQMALPMVFRNEHECHLLLTDHVKLSSIYESLSKELIVEKVRATVDGLRRYFGQEITSFYFAGLNPHAGEGGLLGLEEAIIGQAMDVLRPQFPSLKFLGPLSGDSLHYAQGRDILKIFTFHDQSLPLFKGKFDWYGLNLTFGLPFLRMSVGHGTAFGLYGKNTADYRGAYYQLSSALKVQGSL